MRIERISTLRMLANDVTKSRDWYRSFLGLEPMYDSDVFVSFMIGDVALDIALADAKNPFSAGGSVGYWLVEDVEKVVERAIALGGRLYRGPLPVEETRRVIAQIQDPFGNVLGFESSMAEGPRS